MGLFTKKGKNRDFGAVGQEAKTDSWKTGGKGQQDVQDATAEVFDTLSSSMRVTLSFRCHRLPNADGMFSKTDAFLVVGLGREVLGRTEVVSNNLNPVFAKSLEATYSFEEKQQLGIGIYQAPPNCQSDQTASIDLKKCLMIGSATCLLAEIVASPGGKKTLAVKGIRGTSSSVVTVIAQEVFSGGATKIVRFSLLGHKLDKKDFMGKSDPYYKIFHMHESDAGIEQVLSFKSEVVRQNLNPVWAPVELKLSAFGGDVNTPFRMEVWDWDRDGSHDFIGELKTTIQGLQGIQRAKTQLDLVNPKKRGGNKVAGHISVASLEVVSKPTFLQYIAGGCEINFNVAIDFTASNGDPRNTQSLHHIQTYDSKQLNPYQQCILAVADVLQHYDDDQRYPCFGFGAVLTYRSQEKSHCFALTRDESAPEVNGVQGIMAAYTAILPRLRLSGPTVFSQVINTIAARTRERQVSQQNQSYQVLLIITDGEIQDLAETIDAIVDASSLGISIVIVGVGKEDFSKMEILDGDEQRLKGTKGFVERDIVQFVPYRDFVKDGQLNHVDFSRALLEEIPAQLLSYFESKNIQPNRARDAEVESEVNLPPSPTSSVQTGYIPVFRDEPPVPFVGGDGDGFVLGSKSHTQEFGRVSTMSSNPLPGFGAEMGYPSPQPMDSAPVQPLYGQYPQDANYPQYPPNAQNPQYPQYPQYPTPMN